MQIRRPEAN